MNYRETLRKTLRSQRQQLNPEVQISAAQQLTAQFITQDFFIKSQHIAAYCAVQGEIDPRLILERAWELKKHCYLPVLKADSRELIFVRTEKNTLLKKNRFGIPEPEITENNIISPTHLDLVILPLVAFDPQGYRLGTGKGYYDFTFHFLLAPRSPRKPTLVGVGYAFQAVIEIQPHANDVPLDAVVTEKGISPTH